MMKTNMKKRLLSLLLTLVMILGMIPATTLTASAAEIKDADISKFEQYVDYVKDEWGYQDNMNLAMITDVEIHSTGWLPNAFNVPSRYYNNENSYSVTVNPQTGEKTYSYDYSPIISYGAVTSSQSKDLSYETFPGSTQCFAWEPNRNGYGAAYLKQLIAVFNVSTHAFMEDPNNLPAGAYITGFRFFFGNSTERDGHLSGFPTATDYGVDLNKYINITVDGKKATRQEGSVDGLSIKNLNPIPYTYQVTDTLRGGMALGSYCDALSDAMVWGPVVYVYDEKPEIKSVTVNGQSVADEGTFTTNNRNVTIKATYDSVLSDALTAYGCKVEHLSDWYLNGQHINVAKATPVDQGDGTSTKTHTRPLNDGDVLKVYGRLEVIWPDGSRDIVDEHTVTAMYVDADFESIYPVPTSTELTNKYTDLGTMNLGSSATNIDFKAFPKKLPAAAISDGWTTGRSISVTRDGVEIYNRTYADNELFGWNLKDNIDEGGTYLITLRVFAQKGEQIVEKTHKFRVFVKGSTIKTIALEGVGTPVIGKSPSTINTVKSNTDGVIVNKVVWTEYKQGDGGVWDWFNMSAGSKFESGKRYAVIVEFKHEDGYNFTANKADMTVYINGQKAKVNAAYSSDAFGVTLEFDPITTPTFTTQPVGGEAPYGGKYTVNWATNFTPCKIVVGEYNSLNQVVNQVEYSNTTTSVELPANRYGYVVIAYYNDANAKYSNKITITEPIPAFTTQPVGGTVGYNERHTVNWATNFDAVKQELVRYSSAGSVLQNQSLDAGAFQAGLSYMTGGYYYRIRAYYDSTSYIESDKIYVTPDQYFSPNPQYGNTEEDIIEGITYVPNGDGTFNAHVHVDVSCVDEQMLQYAWSGTGYRWYDTQGHSHYGSVGVDTNWLTFTLDNLGKNLEPGKEWEVKVYLADDYYADYEWQGYSFNYFTDTVPELKPEDVLRGDLNDDGSVDNLDVEYLLWHTLFPDEYTLNQDGDFTGDGSVDNLDVEYLLWHTLFPEEYPL